MPGYDSWKTRSPDDDLPGSEEPSHDQQRADYEDEVQNAGYEPAISDETDIRWAVNVLLEKIAAKFDAWETMDLFRSEAAETVRSFKHSL
jgi:hypothetical protein